MDEVSIRSADKTDVRAVLSAFLIAVLYAPLHAAWPRPSGYVNDFAAVLTREDVAYLEDYLRAVERDTTAEIVVATVTSLDGMTIEEYANRLFAEWGVGKDARDNGILLLVAPADRRVRIEVGYGLEGLVPDGLAGEIIRTAIVPEFQQGNLRRGIGRGLDRLARIVRGDASAQSSARVPSAPAVPPALVIVLMAGTFVAVGSVALVLGYRRRQSGYSWSSSNGSSDSSGSSDNSSSSGSSDSSSSDSGGGSSGGGGASGSW